MSGQDLHILVDETGQAAVPAKVAPAAGFWASPRNKALAGAGLLALLLVPAVVVPAVVVPQQKAKEASSKSISESAAGAGTPSSQTEPVAGTEAETEDKAGGITVPTRTTKRPNITAAANKTVKGLPKVAPEPFVPFVRINDGQFDWNCRPYYPTGFNAFELTSGTPADVDKVFSEAAGKGMSTARTWAHSISEKHPFQTAAGKYDPAGLKALDYVLDSAARHNITLILSFIDNWKYYNGIDQYIDWSTTAPGRTMQLPLNSDGDVDSSTWTPEQKTYETGRHALFFTDPGSKKLYQDHVKFIVNRVNSINGRAYKNDPTILAWNLVNEPRCETWLDANSGCVEALDSWLADMAAYVKQVDPNHLVTTGSEGFFGPSDPSLMSKNPAEWAGQTGQDYLKNNKHMDFAVTHAWPDNWMIPNERQGQFLGEWLQSHLDGAKSIDKPLLFEEFGKKLEDPNNAADIGTLRDPVYQAAYTAVEKAIQSGEPLLGSMYWKWDTPTLPKGPYGVSATDSTMVIINAHAKKVYDLTNAVPPRPGCIKADTTERLGAWFKAQDAKTLERGCVNNPEVSLAYYTLFGGEELAPKELESLGFSNIALGYARALRKNQVKVWATREECCTPGFLGAWAQGCTNME